MKNIKIYYAYNINPGYDDDQTEEAGKCHELFKDILSHLEQKFDGLGMSPRFSQQFEETRWENKDFDLIAGDPSALQKQKGNLPRPVPAVLILSGDVWGDEVSNVLRDPRFDIRGVFLASRLWPQDKCDIEDFSALTVIMKNMIRQILRARQENGKPLLHEEDLSKRIDWKVTVSGKKDSGFISLFSDPSMQSMSRKYKDALLDLRRPFFKEFRDKLDSVKKSTSSECLKEYKEKTEALSKSMKNDSDGGIRIPSLLLLGETGCGKSLLARASASVLSDGKFYRANIAAYPGNSIDGFLFGSVKGSYTSSQKDIPGVFIAHCGETVFLDEIGDMNVDSQTRLLTYMDDGKVTPLGMSGPILAPCILIAATNKPIDDKDSSDFRQDIVHRFDHIIKIPPLRERKQDLRLLISLTLQDDAINPVVEQGKEAPVQRRVGRISLDVIKYLEGYDFPGNYRELEFILRQAVNRAFAEGSSCICVRHIMF